MRSGAWADSRARFEAANAIEETGEAHDGIATCCRYLGELDESLAARERAFRLFRERGNIEAAAMAASWLALDSPLPRGEASLARAWFTVARRLLKRTDSPLARGTVDLTKASSRCRARWTLAGPGTSAPGLARPVAKSVISTWR